MGTTVPREWTWQLMVKALFLKLSGTSISFSPYILGERAHCINSPTVNGDSLSCQGPEALGTAISAFLPVCHALCPGIWSPRRV